MRRIRRASRRRRRAEDPYTVNAPTRAYRARKHGAVGFHTPEQAKARRELFGGCCWLCGVEARALDHVKPLTKGGSDFASNLRPICKPCNSRKGNCWPLPRDWHRRTLRAAFRNDRERSKRPTP